MTAILYIPRSFDYWHYHADLADIQAEFEAATREARARKDQHMRDLYLTFDSARMEASVDTAIFQNSHGLPSRRLGVEMRPHEIVHLKRQGEREIQGGAE